MLNEMINLQKKNIEHDKLEIINIKEESSKKELNIREFGFAKGTFTSISDDFDEPLEEFKEYMP